MGRDLEETAKQHAIEALAGTHFERVKAQREELVHKTMAGVKDRLTKEIQYWDHRAEELKLQELAGRKPRINSGNARRRAEDLESRLEARMKELEKERDAKSSEADHLLHRHHRFANAVALFQVSIALGAVAAKTATQYTCTLTSKTVETCCCVEQKDGKLYCTLAKRRSTPAAVSRLRSNQAALFGRPRLSSKLPQPRPWADSRSSSRRSFARCLRGPCRPPSDCRRGRSPRTYLEARSSTLHVSPLRS